MASFAAVDYLTPSPIQRTPDTFLDKLAWHVAMSTSQRVMRPSHGSRTGSAMRIVKPGSNNHSPRAILNQQRRRTMMTTESLASQRQWAQYQEQLAQQQAQQQAYLALHAAQPQQTLYAQSARKAARPVSWHPSTAGYPPQQRVTMPLTSSPSTYQPCDMMGQYPKFLAPQFPPTPAAYSNQASPTPSLSSGTNTLTAFPQYFESTWQSSQTSPVQPAWNTMATHPPQDALLAPAYVAVPSQSPPALAWDDFANPGYRQVTAPPTPMDLPIDHQPVPLLTSNVTSTEEDEGEILIGMGLYDTPEKSSLGGPFDDGSALFGSYDQSPSKGLKLEDPWSPPEVDDASDDEDADGQAEETEI